MIILLIFLGILLTCFPIIPPIYIFDQESYTDQSGREIKRQKQPVLRYVFHQLIGLVQELLIGLAVAISLRGAITIIIFAVIGSDLYFKKGLSSESVVITILGVITLYLEQLITTAEEIDFKIFRYKSKNNS